MKFSILYLALFIAGCGKYGTLSNDEDKVGFSLPVVTSFDPSDRSAITQICNSISSKESRLAQLVGINQSYNISQKVCLNDEIVEEGINVVIQDSGGGNFTLRRVDNVPFVFSNVETLSSNGILASICNALPTTSTTPEIAIGSSILQFTTIGIDPSFCSPSGEEICLRVVSASSTNRVVHTKEWIKVFARPNTANQNKSGLVTDRRKVTAGFCGQDQVTVQRASLQ
jgi:hypothetical protein